LKGQADRLKAGHQAAGDQSKVQSSRCLLKPSPLTGYELNLRPADYQAAIQQATSLRYK
jgi:hypothetical protein